MAPLRARKTGHRTRRRLGSRRPRAPRRPGLTAEQRQLLTTTVARAAREMVGNDDDIAHSHPGSARADLDDLANRLVADRKRLLGARDGGVQDRLIEVARRGHDRTHQRVRGCEDLRVPDPLIPGRRASAIVERLHARHILRAEFPAGSSAARERRRRRFSRWGQWPVPGTISARLGGAEQLGGAGVERLLARARRRRR